MQTIVLLLSLLSSNIAVAWPGELNKYFNIINNQGKSLTISINNNAIVNRRCSAYTATPISLLHNTIEEFGPLMITVRDSRTFTITNLGERVTPNHRSLSFIFHINNPSYPLIYMPGGETERATINTLCINDFIAVSDIFTWQNLEKISALYNSWRYYFRHIQDFDVAEPPEFITMPLARQHGCRPTISVTGRLIPENYENMCARLTRYIFSPLVASIAMCMNLIYTTKNTKKE